LKLDEYRGPITRSKRKQLHTSEIEKNPLEEKEKLSNMDDREEREKKDMKKDEKKDMKKERRKARGKET
jgi:hypothetical protein